MLPLGWRHLTTIDIQQLKDTVVALSSGRPDLPILEACLLLWSSLVTGRHPENLLPLNIRMLAAGERLKHSPHGLIGRRGRWGWWLATAAPPDQRRATNLMQPTAQGIYLPTTAVTALLIDKCVALRRRDSAGRFMTSGTPEPISWRGLD